MSKLARVLAIGALLTAMSLASTANAQSSDTSSPLAGATQPGQAPATEPGSTTPTTPLALRALSVMGSARQGRVGTTVALTADLSSCSQLTSASGVFLDHAGGQRQLVGQTVTRDSRFIARYTVTARDAVGWGRFKVACYHDMTTVGLGNFSFQVLPAQSDSPRELSVVGSARQGQMGTAVALTVDLRGCPDPISASGLFVDHAGRGRPLVGQTVTRDSRFIARYTVAARDAVGWGHFKITCYRDTATGMTPAGMGNFSFQVLPARPGPLAVTASPTAGGPGTVVMVTAEVRGGCDPADASFQDRKGWGVSTAAKHAPIVRRSDRQLVARYTVSNRDAVGQGRFVVACDRGTAGYRVGSAAFQVRGTVSTPTSIPGPGPGPGPGGDPVDHHDKDVQVPTQIDTGLGGTADRGLDPVRLLLPAGLLLIVLAAGLWLAQTTARRRR